MLSIDLAASPKRPTGYAYFSGGKIKTGVVYSDDEIFELAEEHGLIGIDAPLSLPAGRKSINDGGRHFRECDEKLKALGIPFFPITLGPMRKLTERGMKIAKELKEKGKDVVELFPGASLDLLGLPRKNAEAVNDFLSPFNARAKSIDESDAAIGLFTLWLYKKGYAYFLEGKDGAILLPKPAVNLGKLKAAVFLQRLNRFVVEAEIGGRKERIYMRDTGRLREYLVKGNKIYLAEWHTKFKYILRAVNWKGSRVMVDPFFDNKMAALWLRMKGVKASSKATKCCDSVFDLSWRNCIAEVKGANMHYGDYAVFPDAYSKRAERHFKTLASMEGCRHIIFVAHFPAKAVAINPAYPKLNEILKEAKRKGVVVSALSTNIIGNYWVFEKEVEFVFDL